MVLRAVSENIQHRRKFFTLAYRIAWSANKVHDAHQAVLDAWILVVVVGAAGEWHEARCGGNKLCGYLRYAQNKRAPDW